MYTFVVFGLLFAVVSCQEAGFYRVETELIQLQNPMGVSHDGSPCDRMGVCDPKIKVYLDTDRPLAAFPGNRFTSQYDRVFAATDNNSPMINKQISRDICGGTFSKGNLRVQVTDDDTFLRLTDDHISDFECLFSPTPAEDEATAQWTRGQSCVGSHNANKVKLFYNFRVFKIPQAECGRKSGIPPPPKPGRR